MSDEIEYHRIRAPGDGQALIVPTLAESHLSIERNRSLRSQEAGFLFGHRFSDLAQEARAELLSQARSYTSQYRDVRFAEHWSATGSIILSGHQPQLFHPGVWFKNFALSQLGKSNAAAAINLIIDNDVVASTNIRVPYRSGGHFQVDRINFDVPGDEVPFEERAVIDRDCFQTFGDRVAASVRSLIDDPTVVDLWPVAVAAERRSGRIGSGLAEARHTLEGRVGLQTLELPLSHICESRSFRRFMLHVCASAESFAVIYNDGIAEYRRVHRIRSRSHPVPELQIDAEWVEVPFWIWNKSDRSRRRLFVRRCWEHLELSDRGSIRLKLETDNEEKALDQLFLAAADGVRIRTRALTTTMYARLILSDLFLHGIGGGKYDQLTDAIIARFFRVTPPQFMIITATCRLPVDGHRATQERRYEIDRLIRSMRFNPETQVTDRAASALVEEKRDWLRKDLAVGHRFERHEAIQRINSELQRYVSAARERLIQERLVLVRQLRENELLGSREFSFCLFPFEYLSERLLEVLNTYANFR